MKFSTKKKKWKSEVDPDEIFLDSKNIPQFNKQQFEGVIEKPISKKNLLFLGVFFGLIGIVFLSKIIVLQISKGDSYYNLSQRNSLDKQAIFADRGIIYDRNKVPLAWNVANSAGDFFSDRAYIKDPGFGHVLGYVSYPQKDKSGYFWQKEFIGKDGIEKQYNDLLKGENGVKIFETDVHGAVQSENVIEPPKHGETLTLSIDSRIQAKLYDSIRSFSANQGFRGGVGILMDVQNGEVLALTNYPEYESEVLTRGDDQNQIKAYLTDKDKVFLNRGVSGLYTPGSIVKPIVALAALNEHVIDPLTKILSTGSISIPNPYYPDKKSVFNDWKAHGWIDMRQAIAASSDVYFYEVGGGFENQKGLGISNIEKYTKLFGIGEKTGIDLPAENSGVIPTPLWKQENFPNDPWRVGDTYNTSIGQYGYQVTPLEMLRATAAIANYGKMLKPHLLTGGTQENFVDRDLGIPKEYFDVVHDGMRMSATEGTASRLGLPFVKVSAKTGTAQLGLLKQRVNSWVIGFFPSDAPRYAFIVLMENGPATNTISASLVMAETLTAMNDFAPEYLK